MSQWPEKQSGTATSYAGSYLSGVEALVKSGEGKSLDEFLGLLYKSLIREEELDQPPAILDEQKDALVLTAYEKIKEYNEARPKSLSKKTIGNYTCTLPYYVDFLWETNPALFQKSRENRTAPIRIDFDGKEKRFPQKILTATFINRLRTQERHHVGSGFIFPIRFYAAQKHFPDDSFAKEWMNGQVKKIVVLISAAGESIPFQKVEELILCPAGENYEVLAKTKSDIYRVFSRCDKVIEPFIVRRIADITLDHQVSLDTLFTSLVKQNGLPYLQSISKSIHQWMTEHRISKRYIQLTSPERQKLFAFLLNQPVREKMFVSGIAEEFQMLGSQIQLELMHGKCNSSKNNRV